MEAHLVECLHCGRQRSFAAVAAHTHDAGECPRCGYVGWAYAEELSEPRRRELRDRPLETRRRVRAPTAA